ncbi:MAG TPA: GNAT family N-acetyltransferase [Tissierellia bacterium]|nr:GNAT family N-acetyltransferase [Tissierellia bacterium]
MNWTMVPFEEMSAEDLYDAMKLRFDVFVLEQQCLYQEFDGRDKTAVHLLLRDEEELIGTVRVLEEPERIFMGRIVLAPEYRSKGLGKEMMEYALHYIIEHLPKKDVELQAQSYAQGFYESLGFEATSPYYIEDGIEHVDMKWRRK